MQITEIKVFTVKQVAAMLRRHPETIKKWIRDGHLRAARAGQYGKYLIPEDSIDEFLNGTRNAGEDTN